MTMSEQQISCSYVARFPIFHTVFKPCVNDNLKGNKDGKVYYTDY